LPSAWRSPSRPGGFPPTGPQYPKSISRKSGIGLTPLKRFEKTGAITLRNLVALLRALNLLDGLDALIPSPNAPGPLALLAAEKKQSQRQRAPRANKEPTAPRDQHA
jgi:hypothetical protein